MRVRSEVRLLVGGLLLLQITSAFTAIGVLGRMSPEIGRILEDNVRSIEAAEDMLTVLATPEGLTDELRQLRFEQALEVAQNNITEDEERPILQRIDTEWTAAQTGDPAATRQLVLAVRQLADVNHNAMRIADESAQRLGFAGAWAAVGVSLFSVFVSILMLNRITGQVVSPIESMRTFADAVRMGDPLRRALVDDSAVEFNELARALNSLLDAQAKERKLQPTVISTSAAALGRALELLPNPAIYLNEQDTVLRANDKALDLLATEEGQRQRTRVSKIVRTAEHDDYSDDALTVLHCDDGCWLVVFREPREPQRDETQAHA
jgi:nitrate/nitrite-specific signal transduction histidine kinase